MGQAGKVSVHPAASALVAYKVACRRASSYKYMGCSLFIFLNTSCRALFCGFCKFQQFSSLWQ